jgi:hypothetical protein
LHFSLRFFSPGTADSIAHRGIALLSVLGIVSCRLSEDQYLNNIGRKQAPHFGADSRRIIYQVFAAYEAVSVCHAL